jgi:mannose/cellobiose epimerase-like protein (N-acyl-D-glucosamine 2-epimerase family)
MTTIYEHVRRFLSLLLENGYKFAYTEAMLSFWPWQVKTWGVPAKLALWSSEGQNRQLAGVHLDLDTAGETWFEQVVLFALSLLFHPRMLLCFSFCMFTV